MLEFTNRAPFTRKRRLIRGEQQRDLVFDRDVERIDLDRTLPRAIGDDGRRREHYRTNERRAIGARLCDGLLRDARRLRPSSDRDSRRSPTQPPTSVRTPKP